MLQDLNNKRSFTATNHVAENKSHDKHVHASHPISALVIPFKGLDLVLLHRGKGVDEVCAQVQGDVVWYIFTLTIPVLCPVAIVTHALPSVAGRLGLLVLLLLYMVTLDLRLLKVNLLWA